MALNILEICRLTPDIKHWIPSKEYKIWREALKIQKLPKNVCLRMSSPNIDQEPLKGFENTSTVHKDKNYYYKVFHKDYCRRENFIRAYEAGFFEDLAPALHSIIENNGGIVGYITEAGTPLGNEFAAIPKDFYESVLFTSFGGEMEWDAQGDVGLVWSDLVDDGGERINVLAVLDALYLDIQITGVLYRQ